VDQPLEPVRLAPDRRVTLGASKTAEPTYETDRISLGRPVCVPLDAASVDADTRVFLESRRDSTYWLLGITCSFRAHDQEPMESAWLEVQLRDVEPDGVGDPTAWSMEPQSLHDPMEVSRVAKLDAVLKLKSDLVPVEVGPSVSKETGNAFTKRLPYIEAHREGTARPAWIFTRTPVTEIRGVHRLRAVIELPASATGAGEVSVGAADGLATERSYAAVVLPRDRRTDLDGGWVRVELIDAWVWDMFRPARFVSSVRVVTRHDVNVEELRLDSSSIPDAPDV
jgi:hypothetical protein